VSSNPQPLPMAPSGCELDDRQLAEQLARYQRLSASVLSVERDGTTARVRFARALDTRLLDETLAIERGCCSFFTLDYNSSTRVLSVGTEPEPERADALSVLLTALTASSRR
jgi:hypothetical protein